MNVDGRVLAVLAEQPAQAGALVRAVGGTGGEVFESLQRLLQAGCVVALGSTYRLTRRGRRELRLQRLLAGTAARVP